jgi:hypothetical protein
LPTYGQGGQFTNLREVFDGNDEFAVRLRLVKEAGDKPPLSRRGSSGHESIPFAGLF